MSKLADRFTQLDKRARVLLAAGTALALIVVAGGSVLTLHPTLAGRSERALPGTTIWVDGVTYHQVSPAALWGTGSTNCLGGSGALHTQLVTCITTQVDDNTLWYLDRSSCWMIAQASAGGCPSSRNLHGVEVKDGSSLPAGS